MTQRDRIPRPIIVTMLLIAAATAATSQAAEYQFVAAERIAASAIVLEAPLPAYPRRALARGISGWVQFDATMGPDGAFTEVTTNVSPGGILFARSATIAFRGLMIHHLQDGDSIHVVYRFDGRKASGPEVSVNGTRIALSQEQALW